MTARKFEDVREQLTLVHDELVRRQASQTQRLTAVQTASGLLVGSAALISALLADRALSLPVSVALAWAFIATLWGAAALYPRTLHEFDMTFLRSSVLPLDRVDAWLWMIDHRAEHIRFREKTIAARFRILRSGLIALIIAVILVAIESGTFLLTILTKG